MCNDRRFGTSKKFADAFDITEIKGQELPIIIFIIMDLDDCKNDDEQQAFMDGSMFKKKWFSKFIRPIYNRENLEATMLACGYKVTDKKQYSKIFNGWDLAKIKAWRDQLRKYQQTNMEEYIDYCISIAEKNLIHQN